jgi:hypothetical protein
MLNTRLGKDIKRNDNEQKEIGERERENQHPRHAEIISIVM